MSSSWDEVAAKDRPSWYLDREIARQKRDVHQELIRRWLGRSPQGRILKTDLFEDAWGEDAIFSDLFEFGSAFLIATDIAPATTEAAKARDTDEAIQYFVCDIRELAIGASTLDAIVSTSTLDHFKNKDDFSRALAQLCYALRPGGRLVITLDNPLNPSYWALRMLSHLRAAPYLLGYTPRLETLARELPKYGLEVSKTAWLIHNPRLISTGLVWMARSILRSHADRLIRGMLWIFDMQGRLWPKFSACFYGLMATKRR